MTPNSGPALGGNSVVVSATGLAAGASITLGGITVTPTAFTASTVALPTGTFTVTMPPKAAGMLQFQVTSTGGPERAGRGRPVHLLRRHRGPSPETMPASQAAVFDIKGTGFSSLTFSDSGTLTDTNAHVFLVSGGPYLRYTGGTNYDKAECGNVTVLNDQELICVLDATLTTNSATVAPPVGAYSVILLRTGGVASPDTANGNLARQTIITSTSTFTIAPYDGEPTGVSR